ncbi:MAG: hypothetical protein LBJ16_01580 [Holosporaceae bacterium]|nr:hypothetical protein [Holosporaceae bacterium]
MYFEDFGTFIEVAFGFCLFVNALLFVPQAVKIYKTKNAESLSLMMFLGFNISQIITVIHASIFKDSVLMYGSLLALISCGTVTFLIMLYRR